LTALAALLARLGAGGVHEQHDAHEAFTALASSMLDAGTAAGAVLHGRLRRSVVCTSCGHESVAPNEPFSSLTLSLPARGAPTRADATSADLLRSHFAPEEADEAWRCGGCAATGARGVRLCGLLRAPDVLTLCVGRFGCDGCGGRVDRSAVWPSAHLTVGGAVRYSLRAVVCHLGRSRDSGHYVAAVRRPMRCGGQWHFRDDAKPAASLGPPASWRGCGWGEVASRGCYLLLYERLR
jgi:ubiquitin C-terminal hydrolase